jgi:murein DD-endopeptidase MepM/ murein hydrolase activator NlpD
MRSLLAKSAKILAVSVVLAIALLIALAQKTTDHTRYELADDHSSKAERTPVSFTPNDGPCIDADSVIVPVANVQRTALTDTFNAARSEGRRHDAIDIMAPLGTQVIAAASGRLEKLFRSVAGGNTVYVRSFDRSRLYYYAHLDRYAPNLHEGQQVDRGAVLGAVGYSGNASAAAPHLHFAILATEPGRQWWEPSQAINPYPYLMQSSDGGCRQSQRAK